MLGAPIRPSHGSFPLKLLNRRTRLSALALILFVSTTGFVHDCGGNGAPPPAGCDEPAAGSFTLTIGTEDAASAYVPLAEGDPVTVVQGSQGASMFPVRVAIFGGDAPSCVAAQVEVRDGSGMTLDTFEGNLTVADDGTQRTTEVIYFVIADEWPASVQLAATVGATTALQTVQIPLDR